MSLIPPIDWTNATVQGAWVAGVFAIVGVLIGVGGTLVGTRAGTSAAKEATRVAQEQGEKDREDAATARREAAEAERFARFRDEKRELYTALWIACDHHMRDVEAQVQWRREMVNGKGGQDPGIGSTEPARRANLALFMLADVEPSLAAGVLYSRTVALGANHAYVPNGQRVPAPDEGLWTFDFNAWNAAAADYQNAVSADLNR